MAEGCNPIALSPEQQLNVLLHSVQDYAFIILNLDNSIVSWSTGAEHIVGWAENEVLGQSGAIIFTPEDRAAGAVEQETTGALRDGRAEDERWHLRKDGSRIWGSGVMTLLRDDAGQPLGFAKVLRDKTKQHQAEQALRESEERLRLLVNNIKDCALFQADPSGRITHWNPGAEQLFGYSGAEMLGRDVADLLTPEDRTAVTFRHPVHHMRASDRTQAGHWVCKKDGSRFWARWVLEPIRDENGAFIGIVGILRDETESLLRETQQALERERLEDEVQATTEALGQTRAELRALSAHLMTAQEDERRRIAGELHDDLAQRAALAEFSLDELSKCLRPDASQGALRNLRECLAYLSNGLRQMSHRLHPSVIADLGLSPAISQLVNEFREVGVDVVFVERSVRSYLPVDVSTALYRITQEALRNAVKHAKGDPVRVLLTEENNELHLTIQDAGPGFDLLSAKARGGLGLVSMQERARLIGGSFLLRTNPGDGTLLLVRVPLSDG